MKTVMPEINVDQLKQVLSEKEFEIAQAAFVKRGNTYRLKASKPQQDGPYAYVWRMICYIASPKTQHHCMPVGADFYIRDFDFNHRDDKYIPRDPDCETVKNWDTKTWNMMHKSTQRKNYIKYELDPIVDKVLDTIPKTQWHGAKRWSKAIYG